VKVTECKKIVDKYEKLVRDEIPNATKEIIDIDNKIYSQQKEIADEVKKQRDEYIKAEQEKTEATKKEIEKRKKALEDLKKKEDNEDALNEKQKALNELENKLQDALRTGDQELIKEARKQIADAQNELSKTIADQEYQKSMDRLDEESTYVEDSSQSKIDNINKQLSDDKILELVQKGVTDINGMLNAVSKSTADLPKSFNEVGNILQNQWVKGLIKVSDILNNIKGMTIGLNTNINTPDIPVTNKNTSPTSVTYKAGDLIIQGNITEDIFPKVEKMMDERDREIYKNINEEIHR
jgi:chromosome segregation ATPase